MSEEATDEELVAGLRKRDRAFAFRIILRLSVAILLGIWIFLQLTDTEVGTCAARGFGSVTESPSR